MDSERNAELPAKAKADIAFYQTVRAAKAEYRIKQRAVIAPYSGYAVTVARGDVFRLLAVEGAQCADIALWNSEDVRETFRPEHSFLLEGAWIDLYTQLWSDVPFFRPLATCVEDTVVTIGDKNGWHHHGILGSHCTSELLEARSGESGLNSCHMNFVRAIESYGLNEFDLVDNFWIFFKARIDGHTGRLRYVRADVREGDYIDFYAEIDLLVGISNCPVGDGSMSPTLQGSDRTKSIGLEIYETGITPKQSPRWTEWRSLNDRARIAEMRPVKPVKRSPPGQLV